MRVISKANGTFSLLNLDRYEASLAVKECLKSKRTKEAVVRQLTWENVAPLGETVQGYWIYAHYSLKIKLPVELIHDLLKRSPAGVFRMVVGYIIGQYPDYSPMIENPRKFLESLDSRILTRLWKRSSYWHRNQLAKYMPANTLPFALTFLSNERQDKDWRNIAEKRLNGTYILKSKEAE